MRGVMLRLRSIWREVDVVLRKQLDSTRKILHGLKVTRDDAVGDGWNWATGKVEV